MILRIFGAIALVAGLFAASGAYAQHSLRRLPHRPISTPYRIKCLSRRHTACRLRWNGRKF